MFYRWRTRRAKERFYRQTAGIMDTPPMPVADAPWTIISMVSNSDPQMYILAMKSFYRRIKRGKITAIVDRDMPEALRATLRHHLPGIHLTNLEEIDTGPCQRGGTWERILYVLDNSASEYTIQLDADTLTFGPEGIDEVIRCIENNISFTLGNAGRPIEPMLAIVENARAMKSDYVGLVLEANFDRYPGADKLKYVRASSGFCGYAKGGISRRAAEEFHIAGEKLLGERFKEWGTEQSVSNFVVANTPGAVVLPYPKYANFWGGLAKGKSSFLHFIGANRYLDGYFADQAQGVIAELIAAANDGMLNPAQKRENAMRVAGLAFLLAFAAAPAACLMAAVPADGAEISVLMPPIIANAGFKELSAAYTKDTGNSLATKVDEMGKLMDDIKGASPAPDVIFLPTDLMSDLEKSGELSKGSRAPLGRVEIGLAVRPGAPHPDISTVAKLAAVLKGAKSVVYSNPAGGSLQAHIIDEMLKRPEFTGVNKMISAKGNGAAALARGEAEMALQLEGELIGHEGLELVGPLPQELGASIDTETAVPAGAAHAQEGLAFVRYLTRPDADAVWKSHGLARQRER